MAMYLSEVGEVCLPCRVRLVLEVLVLTELREQREENVQTFNQRLIVSELVHWDVEHCQDNPSIVAWVHIDVSSRETELLQSLL